MWLLVHGFNTKDGGIEVFQELINYLELYNIEYKLISYKFNFTLDTNDAIDEIMKVAKPGCKIVAHSNGCTAAYECAWFENLWIKHLIMVAPPLDTNIIFPSTIDKVDICWNKGDVIVELSKLWRGINDLVLSRDRILPTFGSMGRRGPFKASNKVRDYKFMDRTGHSGYFKYPQLKRILKIMEI